MSGEDPAGPSVQRRSVEDVEEGVPPVAATEEGAPKGRIKGRGLTEGDEGECGD